MLLKGTVSDSTMLEYIFRAATKRLPYRYLDDDVMVDCGRGISE